MNPTIRWTCNICSKPITQKAKGAIWCNERAAWDLENRYRQLPTIVCAKQLAEMPPRQPWRANHYKCDGPQSCYWFDTTRADTVSSLLSWNTHLSHKPWVRYTNWPEFLERAITGRTASTP